MRTRKRRRTRGWIPAKDIIYAILLVFKNGKIESHGGYKTEKQAIDELDGLVRAGYVKFNTKTYEMQIVRISLF